MDKKDALYLIEDFDEYINKYIGECFEENDTFEEALNEDLKSTLGKMLATGAIAAGAAFGNTGIHTQQVGPNSVPNDKVGFGKTPVHLQQRYNYKSDKYGVPTTYELSKSDAKKKLDISFDKELEITKAKILATPDSMLRKYGKEHLEQIAKLMIKAANKYNVDIDILLAIAGTETNFDNNRKSDADAVGMMQITKIAAIDSHKRLQGKSHKSFNFSTFKDLANSIDNAGRIVADLSVRRNNVLEMIFASYNGGTSQATAWRYEQLHRKKLPDGTRAPTLTKETRNYVRKCLTLYSIYKKVQKSYNI